MKIPFYKHNLEEEDKNELLDTLNSTFLTTGPKTKLFEEKFANYFGKKGAVGTTSWTAGAFLVLKAWGVGPGDEVIVPAMTFIATANIVKACGAEVVFADSEESTGNIDASKISSLITEKTKVIIPVHLYGQMADMKAIHSLAKEKNIKVLEDCAHCVEGTRDGYQPGRHSDAACFSFYATKNITCGEGGAIISDDEAFLDKLRVLRQGGMEKSAADRYTKAYKHWDMHELGYKSNMCDINASLLIHQIDRMEKVLKRKEEICSFYEEKFSAAGIEFPKVLEGSVSARHLFTIWSPSEASRDELMALLQEKEIGVAVNFRAITILKYYNELYSSLGTCPIAESIGNRTITIPMYPKLTIEQLEYITGSVIECYQSVK